MYKNNLFGALHIILQESDLCLLFSVILLIIDNVKGISF